MKLLLCLAAELMTRSLWAANQAGMPANSSGAGSPFSAFDGRVLIYGLLVAFLVFGLLTGAFLIINLGLLSKRPEDHIGKRTPSDLGILKNRLWPEVPYNENALPAEEDEEEKEFLASEERAREDQKDQTKKAA
jgi:hypothetical protein